MIIAPILVLFPIYLLLCRRKFIGENNFINFKTRRESCLNYLKFTGLFILLGLSKIRFDFLDFWLRYAPGHPAFNSEKTSISNLGNATKMIAMSWPKRLTSRLTSDFLLPSFSSPIGLFNTAECLFIALSIVGVIIFIVRNKNKRDYVSILLLVLILITPSFLHRGAWHYLCIHLAFASIFFSYLIYYLISRIKKTTNKKFNFTVALVVILIVHSMSFVYFIDARRYNSEKYKKYFSAYYQALKMINYDEKIAVIQKKESSENMQLVDIYGRVHYYIDKPKQLHPLKGFFIKLDDKILDIGQEKKLRKIIEEENIKVIIQNDQYGSKIIKKYD